MSRMPCAASTSQHSLHFPLLQRRESSTRRRVCSAQIGNRRLCGLPSTMPASDRTAQRFGMVEAQRHCIARALLPISLGAWLSHAQPADGADFFMQIGALSLPVAENFEKDPVRPFELFGFVTCVAATKFNNKLKCVLRRA